MQLLETITSVAVVGLTLRKFTPLPKDFFRISLKWVQLESCMSQCSLRSKPYHTVTACSPSVPTVQAQVRLQSTCCRHPFRKGDGWLLWAILGIILAPAVIALVATILSAANYDVRLHE